MSRTTITYRQGDTSKFYYQACEKLSDSGWKEIGSGNYGSVWEHPDCDTVLKVGVHDNDNDGWLDYARSCAKTRSPHAPRIEAIEIHPEFYYAELERLQPLPRDRYQAEGLERHGYAGCIQTPSLRAYVRRTERLRRNSTHGPDYHEGNFMVRPTTGEIVCTDPWY